ncbi:MAG: S9 family peptidase [Robiginitomaculum sp.]|nr:MAG: S9 family peptidase [Robiginitomaculum sp.]
MKRIITIGLVASLGLLGACQEAGTQAAKEKAPVTESKTAPLSVPLYDAKTFFETTTYAMPAGSGFAFFPDGKSVLVSSDKSGIFNAYAINITDSAITPLTSSMTNAVYAVTVFPTDGRILYTFDGGGNELNHVYVREEDGATQDLTPGENLKAQFVGWSGDGTGFYLASNERNPSFFDLYRYDRDGYERTLVYENTGYQLSAISPNGNWLALGKSNTSADSDIFLVDLRNEDKTPKLISVHDGDISYGVYGFSADSAVLEYSTNEHGEFNQAWSYDLASGEKSPLVQADWDVSFTATSNSGRYRVTGVNADARTKVTLTNAQTGEALALPDLPPGDIRRIRFSGDESKITFLLNADTSPSNVHVVDLKAGTDSVLTNALNPAIDQTMLVNSQVVRYASFDGLKIPSILYRPKTASADHKAPAIVLVHGGPGGQSRTGYNPMVQHLVNHGYVVLAANNRGSSGYGKTFNHMDDKRHGEVDLQDIVYARKYLESLDWVDGDHVAIMGGSYGGYMVAAALAFEPEVFDAGIDIFGVTNWVRTLKSIPPWWESFKKSLYDEMGDPAVDEERHRRISPLFHAGNITKPLLVVQGVNDPRVLKVESDELVEKVRANGVMVEYLVFPDEGHGFRSRKNRISASEAYVSFLDKTLK